jgi:PAS domain S-box-containing protein
MTQDATSQNKRSYGKVSIRSLMIFPFILQITAAVWIIGYFSFQNEQKNANDFSSKLRANAVVSLKQEIYDYLLSPKQAVKLNSQARKTDPIDTQTSSEIIQQFKRLANVFSLISEINVADRSGNHIGLIRESNNDFTLKITEKYPRRNWYPYDAKGNLGALLKSDLDYDPRSSLWYQKAIATPDLAWTDIYLLANNSLGIAATQAVFDNQGNPKYAIAASINLDKISDLLEKTKVSPSSQIFIVDQSGFVLATSTKTPLLRRNPDSNIQRLKPNEIDNIVIRESLVTANKRFGKIARIQNAEKLEIPIPKQNAETNGEKIELEKQIIEIFPYRDPAGLDWYIFIAIPESEILSKYDNNGNTLIWLCLGVSGILIIFGIQTSRLIVKPIFQLRDASLAIAADNFDQPIPTSQISELSILAQSLERMRSQVSQSREQLQDYSRSLERKVEERTSELEKEIRDRIAIQEELQAKAVLVSQHYQVLNDLAKDESTRQGDFYRSIQKLTEAVAKTLKVERTSVWLAKEDGVNWTCLDLYLLSDDKHILEADFSSVSFPKYLRKLKTELVIAIDDAFNDARTSELADNHLIQFGITSILEIPLRQNNETVGMLSLEHTGEPRIWSLLEQSFAKSICDLVALAIESYNRKLAEQQLKKSEERWQLALEGSNDGIWDWSCQSGEAFYSTRYKTMLGYEESEILHHDSSWLNLIHPDDVELAIQTTNDYLENKTPYYVLEHRLRCKDGSYKWILARAKALFDENGEPVRMIGSHTDITERRRYEEELQNRASTLSLHNQVLAKLARNEKLRLGDLKHNVQILTESVARTLNVERVSVWMAKQESVYWECLNQFTLSSEQHSIEPDLAIAELPQYYEALQNELVIPVTDALRDPRTCELGEDYLMKFGIVSMLEIPIRQKSSTVGVLCVEHTGAMREWTLEDQGFARSIGDLVILAIESYNRNIAEQKLKEGEERWQLALDGNNDGIWDWNCKTNEVFFSSRYKSMLGYSDHEIAPNVDSWLTLIHPEDYDQIMTTVEKYWAKETAHYIAEHRVRCKDSSYKWILARGIALFDEDGTPTRMIGSHTDFTDRKQTEIELSLAKEAADFANKAKSEFLANMSHELRTPLNGILGYVQILERDRSLNPKQLEGINVIKQCGSHLLNLIADILDLSKIEAQKMELVEADFHFLNFLQGIVEISAVRSEQKGITFTFLPSANLPIGVCADEKRLRQVLLNLLGNAIKFTKDGGVTFKVDAIAVNIPYSSLDFNPDINDENETTLVMHKVRFQVEDTGIGISLEQLEKIFLPFEQAGNTKANSEGTGLGLAISQKIVGVMGSTIQVSSKAEKGSTFVVDLNLKAATEKMDWSEINEKLTQRKILGFKGESRTILLVDDKWENRTILVKLLQEIGFEIMEASNGQEALDLATCKKPDLIITDLVMPVMDGFEMIRQFRRSPDSQNIIIIVTSASAFSKDETQSLETGGNDFLPKPIHFESLLTKIEKHLEVEWIYEEMTLPQIMNFKSENAIGRNDSVNNVLLISPSLEEIDILFDLAMQGNINAIIDRAVKLEQENINLAPFTNELQKLASEFQIRKIKEFIKTYRDNSS